VRSGPGQSPEAAAVLAAACPCNLESRIGGHAQPLSQRERALQEADGVGHAALAERSAGQGLEGVGHGGICTTKRWHDPCFGKPCHPYDPRTRRSKMRIGIGLGTLILIILIIVFLF
jgi:hypothetical protein